MSTPLYIIGGGGHAKVVISILSETGYRITGILDDNEARWGAELMEIPIMGPTSLLGTLKDVRAVIAIGNNRVRKAIAEAYTHVQWVTAVHSTAYVHGSSRRNIGVGTVICAGAIIQPDATVGEHSIVNTAATVDHDCRVASFVHLAPGVHLAGGVTVEEGVLMGVGSSAIPQATIGEWSTIGAGAGIIRSIPANVTAIGLSAKPLEKLEELLELQPSAKN